MRRTYKSKKEVGRGLDYKDACFTTNDKSSVFDAFYIQNIIQTKREMSHTESANQYGIASKKIRKRKYVKRIVKEPEITSRESMYHSACLTPDKSIHLNKGPDLFDLLLNTPSTNVVESPKSSKKYFYDKLTKKPSKTYSRKKITKIKQCNYSSSSHSSDSEKENSYNGQKNKQNTPDFRNYELVIEKECDNVYKHYNDSIDNIVKNMPLLNNIHDGSRRQSNEYYNKCDLKKLTSPCNSPLSSTPFSEKTRSKSIYKFSPIPIKNLDNSLKCDTIIEENLNNETDNILETNKAATIVNEPEENAYCSPILHMTKKKNNSKTNSKSTQHFSSSESLFSQSSSNKSVKKSKQSEDNKTKLSFLRTTDGEPFYGFSNSIINTNENVIKFNITVAEDSMHSYDAEVEITVADNQRHLNEIHNQTDPVNEENPLNVNSFENTIPSQLFLGFSNIGPTINVSSDHSSSQNSNKSNLSNDAVEHISSNSSSSSESMYDTCNSDQSFDLHSNNDSREPIVVLEKLNNYIFQKYCEKMADHRLSMSENRENLSVTSTENCSDLEKFDDLTEELSQISLNISKMEAKESLYNSSDSCNVKLGSSSTEKEEIFQFVTTRRRNGMTVVNTNSSKFDKTVINNRKSVENTINSVNSSENAIVKDSPNNITILDYNLVRKSRGFTKSDEKKINGSELPLNNLISSEDNDNALRFSKQSVQTSSEAKTGIVLQPGKKWERSLSIYRRMTLMTDSSSLSNNDDHDCKGQRYRQSVFNTIEMQDFGGSLHNDSINSRRSTFLPKPNRSTICIVKEPNSSRVSLCSTTVYEDLRGFLSEDCDDTIVELSKLSIADTDHEVTVVEKFHDTSQRTTTARDYVLRRCNQTDVILFDECYPETVLKNCHKIGEGVYGEVFLWRARDGPRVMKIVPVAGVTKVNGEHQKDYTEIISEIVIAMELSALRAPIAEFDRLFDENKDVDTLDLHAIENATDVFNEVLAVRCVYGTYPSRLLDLWELYDECKGSENDNPAILPVDQQYIVLELANAGQDLESYQFNNAEQAHALFLQVTFGLAVGEEAFQFEHRDLHWGNVLIAPTDQKYATFILRGRAHRIPRCGVRATIIDYSLSRLSLPLAQGADSAALYNDLAADEGLFDALGDYQFEVYRCMRDKLGNEWKNFEPYTNILWLHYTVDKMITALRYKRVNTKVHKHFIAKLNSIKNRILSYHSAVQFVLTDNEF